jgi:hypothetical protein
MFIPRLVRGPFARQTCRHYRKGVHVTQTTYGASPGSTYGVPPQLGSTESQQPVAQKPPMSWPKRILLFVLLLAAGAVLMTFAFVGALKILGLLGLFFAKVWGAIFLIRLGFVGLRGRVNKKEVNQAFWWPLFAVFAPLFQWWVARRARKRNTVAA